jgi:hypothetical protein
VAGAREALVVAAAHAVVTIGIVAARATVALATFLAGGTFGGEHAHAVESTHVLRARIAIAAVFGAVTSDRLRAPGASDAHAASVAAGAGLSGDVVLAAA